MADADAELRAELVRDGSLFEGYNASMAALHARNADELATRVAEHGWPGRVRVGEEGAEAAWRVLQHAIGDGRMSPWTIHEADGADARRATAGLPPLEEQQRWLRDKREIRDWARKAGWL